MRRRGPPSGRSLLRHAFQARGAAFEEAIRRRGEYQLSEVENPSSVGLPLFFLLSASSRLLIIVQGSVLLSPSWSGRQGDFSGHSRSATGRVLSDSRIASAIAVAWAAAVRAKTGLGLVVSLTARSSVPWHSSWSRARRRAEATSQAKAGDLGDRLLQCPDSPGAGRAPSRPSRRRKIPVCPK